MTIFYSNATDEYRVPGINNRIFDPEWISMYDSFTAHTGEVFALDVSEIHSVSGLVPGRPRVSISCGFQTPFEQLIQFFRD